MEPKRTKEIKEVVALRYMEEENKAPMIIASGKGVAAENILNTALEHKIPVYEDKELAHILTSLNLGDEIPPELYEVVAQILIFVGSIDKEYGG